MDIRYTTTVDVLKASTDCRDERIPHTLDGLIDMLTKARESIPQQYRAAAHVDLHPGFDYDDAYPRIWVTYERPETAGETSARVAGEIDHWIGQRADAERRIAYCDEQLAALT